MTAYMDPEAKGLVDSLVVTTDERRASETPQLKTVEEGDSMPAGEIDTTALEQLEELVHSYDADLKFSTACRTGWSGQLRLAVTNPTGAPSRSLTFVSTGGVDPEHVAAALLADAEAWLAEAGVEPTSVPDWMPQN